MGHYTNDDSAVYVGSYTVAMNNYTVAIQFTIERCNGVTSFTPYYLVFDEEGATVIATHIWKEVEDFCS